MFLLFWVYVMTVIAIMIVMRVLDAFYIYLIFFISIRGGSGQPGGFLLWEVSRTFGRWVLLPLSVLSLMVPLRYPWDPRGDVRVHYIFFLSVFIYLFHPRTYDLGFPTTGRGSTV